jgi:esterase/lipase superfamily enzyme
VTWKCGITLLLVVILSLLSDSGIGDETDDTDTETTRAESALKQEFTIRVFYATNRKLSRDKSDAIPYSSERGEPHFGRCEITFTPIATMTGAARKIPFYAPSETRVVRVLEQIDARMFWERLTIAATQTQTQSVVVFMHGYNYDFTRTCHMAAELQQALGGKSTVVMFSWPSDGDVTHYIPDQADVEWSVPFLARFLRTLSDRVGRNHLHLVAHSLGSRGVIYALERLRADYEAQPVLGHLALLAPDYDAQTFVLQLPDLTPQVRSITLYTSSNDTPLQVSRRLHGHPRLGEAGAFLTLAEGVETIDVSSLGRAHFLGHEYFYYQPRVTADLVTLLTTEQSAAVRPALRAKTRQGRIYWEMK